MVIHLLRQNLSSKMESPTTKKQSDKVLEIKMSWCDMPDDLLGFVINHLDLVDRFHLALVCKSFLAVVRNAPRENGLSLGSPCLLTIGNGSKICSLISPLYKEKYSLNTINLPSKVAVISSKYGWLLMLSHVDRRSIFFYNPLSKATINLPDIDFPSFCAFSFTSPPTSPDCLVVAINALEDWARIYTCHRGNNKWNVKLYEESAIVFDMKYNNLVSHNGIFYCLGSNGMLSTYDPIGETWVVLEKPRPNKLKSYRIHLVGSEVELFRVWTKKDGEFVHIHKLDPVKNQWKAVKHIGDRQLYVGGAASLCSNAVSTEAGRIYFRTLQDEEFVFYSCETGTFHPKSNFFGAKDYPLACWIEPKWIKPSPEELQWSKL